MALSKELEKRMATLRKKFDAEVISTADAFSGRDIPTHSTGSLMLDLALGGGKRAGLPEGRMIEIYGPESSGKTTTCLLAIAARQQEENAKAEADPEYGKKYCVFVDAEHALDINLAANYGVDLEELIIINPETAESAMDALDLLIRSGDIGLAVIDSVPALVPSSMEESSYEQQFMALNARFMSGVCQRITGPLYRNNTTLVFINQVREKVGAWSPTGVAETTPGGRSLKYYATIRMSLRRGDQIKNGDELIGNAIKYRIIKNKIFVPFKEATVNLIYNEGIDAVDEIFQISLKKGYIVQGGAWFRYIDENGELKNFDGIEIKSQGRDKMIQMIRDIPELFIELENKIREVKEVALDEFDKAEVPDAELKE